LVLVGDGPEADALKNAARRHNVKVTFLPFQPQENLCEIYGVADCFVLPSLYGETWGNVVNEAMACRLPVIVSNQCGCAKTLVRAGYNGWQFDPHNIEDLAQLMRRFINLPDEERKQMGEYSLALVSEWGLVRFCEGVWQAVQYCVKKPPHGYSSIIDKMIINYLPVMLGDGIPLFPKYKGESKWVLAKKQSFEIAFYKLNISLFKEEIQLKYVSKFPSFSQVWELFL